MLSPHHAGSPLGWAPGPSADHGEPTALPFSGLFPGEGAAYTRYSIQVADRFCLPRSTKVQIGRLRVMRNWGDHQAQPGHFPDGEASTEREGSSRKATWRASSTTRAGPPHHLQFQIHNDTYGRRALFLLVAPKSLFLIAWFWSSPITSLSLFFVICEMETCVLT